MADIGDFRFVVHKIRLHTVNRLDRFDNDLLDSLEEDNSVVHDVTISRQKHSKKKKQRHSAHQKRASHM